MNDSLNELEALQLRLLQLQLRHADFMNQWSLKVKESKKKDLIILLKEFIEELKGI